MNITTIFFDVDNTLVDHSLAEELAINKLREVYFPKQTREEFKDIWTINTRKNWLLFEAGLLTFEQQRIQRIISVWQAFGVDLAQSKAKVVSNQYLALYEHSWKLFPSVSATLRTLVKMKLPIGIITNGSKSQQVAKLIKMGIYPLFRKDLIVFSNAVGYTKPQIEIFLHAQHCAKTNPENILFVGDNITQ